MSEANPFPQELKTLYVGPGISLETFNHHTGDKDHAHHEMCSRLALEVEEVYSVSLNNPNNEVLRREGDIIKRLNTQATIKPFALALCFTYERDETKLDLDEEAKFINLLCTKERVPDDQNVPPSMAGYVDNVLNFLSICLEHVGHWRHIYLALPKAIMDRLYDRIRFSDQASRGEPLSPDLRSLYLLYPRNITAREWQFETTVKHVFDYFIHRDLENLSLSSYHAPTFEFVGEAGIDPPSSMISQKRSFEAPREAWLPNLQVLFLDTIALGEDEVYYVLEYLQLLRSFKVSMSHTGPSRRLNEVENPSLEYFCVNLNELPYQAIRRLRLPNLQRLDIRMYNSGSNIPFQADDAARTTAIKGIFSHPIDAAQDITERCEYIEPAICCFNFTRDNKGKEE